ncbi:hypothetical protein N7495_001521 [Penicillium taxi]|uniref:uncharacterized protein n=1 Tax=Penicillium taxi TaxID=168475 RepID=UPI0025455514|nr:uncharacterized protein N7495_001521 [Penicillium taxi]KAJ5908839.1 hypothetical protein N7495_001521 [Penicillium taxi]
MSPLPTPTVEALKSRVDSACSDSGKGLPGACVAVVGKDGKLLFSHAAGLRGAGSTEPMSPETVFWIASCTKLITGICAMQLVEQELLSLDDSNQVETICPEIKAVQVLQDDGQLVDKKRGITLRMLLSHTSAHTCGRAFNFDKISDVKSLIAGYGYSLMKEKLRDHARPIGLDEFSGYFSDFKQALVHQPGEAWEYGVSIDWVGVIIERVTGKSLNEYFHEHVFEPLGISHMSMIPTQEMKEKLAYMHQRDSDGRYHVRDHLLRRALTVESESDVKAFFNSGGGGCFSTLEDYCQILAMVLNNGTSPTTGKQLLKKETVDEMFRDQVGHLPPLCQKYVAAAKPDLAGSTTGFYPVVPGDRQGWGLTFMLSGCPSGASVKTAQWSGIPNVFWWCDRENGVAGIGGSQILPFGNAQVFEMYIDVKTEVYKGISGSV